jgi:hypothetical protein
MGDSGPVRALRQATPGCTACTSRSGTSWDAFNREGIDDGSFDLACSDLMKLGRLTFEGDDVRITGRSLLWLPNT